MLSQYHNVWFITFSGIGNGIVVAPILRCFEESYSTTNYFHTENRILVDSWFLEKAGLKNLKGFSPVAWRRFKKEDWPAINSFIMEKKIDLIVNLRNEGPRYDADYYRFKEISMGKMLSAFWDLDFGIIEHRTKHQNLTGDILNLFEAKGIDISGYNSKWLASIRRDGNQRENIGFGMVAGQSNKRWPTVKWIELACKILANSDEKIILFPGQSEKEIKEAESVLRAVGQERCGLIRNKSIKNIASQISGLKYFVSNDTGFLHMSAAISIPTIGLYVSTRSDIWSPYDKTNFSVLQNSFIAKCSNPKPHCGNCFHYYDVCPAIAKYGDDINPDKVYKIITTLVDL